MIRKRYIPRPGQDMGDCELSAVRLLASGLSVKNIAYKRGISSRTVENQLKHAKIKSGCRTLPQLTAWAAIKGLL